MKKLEIEDMDELQNILNCEITLCTKAFISE